MFLKPREVQQTLDTSSNIRNLIDGWKPQVTLSANSLNNGSEIPLAENAGSSSRKRHMSESHDESGNKQMKRHEDDSIGETSRESLLQRSDHTATQCHKVS